MRHEIWLKVNSRISELEKTKQDFNLIFPTGGKNPFFTLAKSTAFPRAAHL